MFMNFVNLLWGNYILYQTASYLEQQSLFLIDDNWLIGQEAN